MIGMRWKLEPPPPVGPRLVSLDRRLIWPTITVLFVVLLWSTILPALDRSVDKSEITQGTVYDMGQAMFTPAPGWVLAKPPSPVGDSKEASLINQGITVDVKGGGWRGDAAALLDQLERLQKGGFVVEGKTYRIQTASGVPGLAKKINGPNFVGLIACFVEDGAGIAVTVKGPAGAAAQPGHPVAQMIRSITFKPKTGRP